MCSERVVGLMGWPLDGDPAKTLGLVAHPGGVTAVAISHNGRKLITAGAQCAFHPWAFRRCCPFLHPSESQLVRERCVVVPRIASRIAGADGTVNMWDINTAALDAQGHGVPPSERWPAVLDDPDLLDDMRQYFVYAQIKSQGEDCMELRDTSGAGPGRAPGRGRVSRGREARGTAGSTAARHAWRAGWPSTPTRGDRRRSRVCACRGRRAGLVPVSMVPDLMRAAGYYPSEAEVADICNNITFIAQSMDKQELSHVDFTTFLQLYINFRPLFDVSAEDIEAAFKALGAPSSHGRLQREALLTQLQQLGERMTADELVAALSALTGHDRVADAMPHALTAATFAADVLGFEQPATA